MKKTFETELGAKDELLTHAKKQALVKADCAAAYTAAKKADCDILLEEMGKEKEQDQLHGVYKELEF